MEVIGKLTDIQYFKWKNGILEMQLAKLKKDIEALKCGLFERDLEILRLKVGDQKRKLQDYVTLEDNAKNEYHTLRGEIEKELGFTIADTVIDEVTYEIKKID